MKVVLLRDVPRLGRVGEVKEVADGYGRNFLLPQKLATLATPSATKEAERRLKQEAQRRERFAAELGELAQQLEGYLITFKAKVATEERLYGSIRDADIAEKLSEVTGFDIDKGMVELEEPLRQLGNYEVTINLGKGLSPRIRVLIEEE